MNGSDIASVALSTGFLLGLGAILSIGPQNMRLIEAGIQRRHAGTVATTGLVSEIAIVTAGIAGLGAILTASPDIAAALRIAGVAFLLWCGVSALRRPSLGHGPLHATDRGTRRSAMLGMLAVTWLNPLVYVEVMLLVGVLSTGFGDVARIWFGAGFLAASAIRFYGWSAVGHLLAPVLSQPVPRRRFDLASGALLIVLAAIMARNVAA